MACAGRGMRGAVQGIKVAVAMVSLVVFGATGYGWVQVHNLTTALSTAEVIDPAAQSPLAEQLPVGEQPLVGEQNLLVVGLDSRTDAQGDPLPADVLSQLHAGGSSDGGDNTDTMMVIHLPAGAGQATVISIPRDSYVTLADGFGQHKINSAYTYGKVTARTKLLGQGVTGAQLATESDQAGARTAIQTVQQLTGLTINHYAAINLAGFYFISQAIGGVPVCLKAPVHDPSSGANFPAGAQTVSGSQALAFVRQRYGLPHGDLDRIKRQQAFMAGMANTVLSTGTLTDPTKLGNLIAAVKKAVVLDHGFDMLSFVQQVQGISAGDTHFVTIPIANITLHTPNDGDAVEVDPQQVQAFIQQQINGHSGPSATSSDFLTNSKVAPAHKILDTHAAPGFAERQARTTTSDTTVTRNPTGEYTAAHSVASALSGGIRLLTYPAPTAGHVRVYPGKDHAGPDTQSITAPATFHLNNPPAQQPPPPTDPPTASVACIN